MTEERLAEIEAAVNRGLSFHGDDEHDACECHEMALELAAEVRRLRAVMTDIRAHRLCYGLAEIDLRLRSALGEPVS